MPPHGELELEGFLLSGLPTASTVLHTTARAAPGAAWKKTGYLETRRKAPGQFRMCSRALAYITAQGIEEVGTAALD
jgi:hypothetical protein